MVTYVMRPTFVQVNTIGLFEPGGAVHIWATGVARVMKTYAEGLAPPADPKGRWGSWSKGALKASIYSEVYEAPATHQVGFEVGARVPYAIYVHDGTGSEGRKFIYTRAGFAEKQLVDGWIRAHQFRGSASDAGFWMPVGKTQGDVKKISLRVKGQKSNPFLSDAYRLTRNRHPGLPHMSLQRKIRGVKS